MVFFPDMLGAVGSRYREMLGFLALRFSRHLSCAVSKSFLSMFYRMAVSSAHESEMPPILGRYIILYIGKICASVCYSENPYLGLKFANIVCNCNW